MCDNDVVGVEALRDAGDAAVVAAIGAGARAEAAAAGHRLAAIAEFVARHTDGPTHSARWSCDNWDAIAAEVAAAQNISHAMASGQMYLGMALRNRLPKIGALFLDGLISARLASTIVWRTDLVKDPDILERVDAALAGDAAAYGPLSLTKTAQRIDAIVERHDPAALRRVRAGARGRDVVITAPDDQSGIAYLWGSLFATDAAILDRRLDQMAHDVCDQDPRTLPQRRADALGALAAGAGRLACTCGKSECPVGADPDPRTGAVVVHVLTDAAALDTAPDPHLSGEVTAPPITADTTLAEALAPHPEPPAVSAPATAHLLGGPTLPAPILAELIRGGATIRPVWHPGDTPPEPGYRPSTALDRFIRCRDATCRFPGCDRAAEYCDIDHTIAYRDGGPTHPSNLACLCRKHHLLKTFWTGWRDRQYPDGTIVWTSPSGHTYTTHPGSRLLFPTLCLPTGKLSAAPAVSRPNDNRTLMMPTRRRTRTQDRAHRINTERALNAARSAERNQPPPL